MKKLQAFETETGKILVEHPRTHKLVDLEAFWLLNENLPSKNRDASPVAALQQLIEESIKFICIYTRKEILESLPSVQQELLQNLYTVKDVLEEMNNV